MMKYYLKIKLKILILLLNPQNKKENYILYTEQY